MDASSPKAWASTSGWKVTSIRNEKRRLVTHETNDTVQAPLELSDKSPGIVPTIVSWWSSKGLSNFHRINHMFRGAHMLEHLLAVPIAKFESSYAFKTHWIRQLSSREREAAMRDDRHPMHMLTMNDIDGLLRRKDPNPAKFLRDVDVTKWVKGKRHSIGINDKTVNAEEIWDAFHHKGYSIRMVHPQQWHAPLYELCSALQEYFGNVVTCSSYLTPPGTQGFGPHYDDAEIFVIQLLGEKKWFLYDRPDKSTSPRTPRVTQFRAEDIGTPHTSLIMRAGDVMYFPRGTVHQAVSCDDSPSLHLTFSTFQQHTWYDFLLATVKLSSRSEAYFKMELDTLLGQPSYIHDDVPINFLEQHSACNASRSWDCFGDKVLNTLPPASRKLKTCFKENFSKCVDQYYKRFLHDSLPPLGLDGDSRNAVNVESVQIAHGTLLRLRFPKSAWMVDETAAGSTAPLTVLYTNVANGRGLHESSSPYFEILPEFVNAIGTLLDAAQLCSRTEQDSPVPYAKLLDGIPTDDETDFKYLLCNLVYYGVLEIV